MIRLYSKRNPNFKMEPSKETIQFLLNFSRSLKVVKSKSNNYIELNLN